MGDCDGIRRPNTRRSPADICRRAWPGDAHHIGARIIALLTEVWDFLNDTGVKDTGHNVVLYSDDVSKALLLTEAEVPIEVGVQITTPCESTGRVVCAVIPGGTVATVVHMGPYQRLLEAHAAMREWCTEHSHALAGPRWEIYGDWTDNPAELRTDVFYLLQ